LTIKTSAVVITEVTLGDAVVQAGRMFLGPRFDPVAPFPAGDDS